MLFVSGIIRKFTIPITLGAFVLGSTHIWFRPIVENVVNRISGEYIIIIHKLAMAQYFSFIECVIS